MLEPVTHTDLERKADKNHKHPCLLETEIVALRTELNELKTQFESFRTEARSDIRALSYGSNCNE
jgi:hypothetical protein